MDPLEQSERWVDLLFQEVQEAGVFVAAFCIIALVVIWLRMNRIEREKTAASDLTLATEKAASAKYVELLEKQFSSNQRLADVVEAMNTTTIAAINNSKMMPSRGSAR